MSAITTGPRPTSRGQKLALTVGYLSLAIAVVAAYANQADGYEVSIYAATPLIFWVGIGITLLVAVPVTIYSSRGYVTLAGTTLSGSGVVAVAALPLLRSYYYYGRADALTHLGWARDIANGTLSAFGLFYPGIHTYGVFISETIGFGLPRALMLVVLLMLITFIVFTTLCVRSMTTHRGAVVLGAFTGLLVLPINQIGTHYMSAHPITDAVLLTPVVLYLLINYFTASTDGFESQYPISSIGVLLVIVLGGIVLYHPQQALNLIILFITFSAIQFIYRSVKPAHRIAEHTTLYGQTLFLIGSFMIWSIGRGRYERTVSIVFRELFRFLGGSEGAGDVTSQRAGSLTEIGASLPEVFLKLFSVSAIFVVLTGLLMLTSLSGRLDDSPDTNALVKYFTVGLAVLVPASLVLFVGDISKLFFRNVGLIMVFATILGTIALYRYITALSGVFSTRTVRAGTTAAVVVMLILSVVVMFPSPYIFRPNAQVPQEEIVNYRIAFEQQADTDPVPIYGIRSGPWRFKHGIYGVEGVGITQGLKINGTNLTDRFPEDRYIAISGADRTREIKVYDQLRYNRSQFAALRNRTDVHRIQSSDGFALYYLPEAGADTAAIGSENTTSAGGGIGTSDASATNNSLGAGSDSGTATTVGRDEATRTPASIPDTNETGRTNGTDDGLFG